jgi:hypothetical protein
MRETLSKHTRFEVFKRDGFTCRYCGRKPPEVILHIDHMLAVSKGGGNEEDNLLTSCEGCNLGKGAGDLKDVLPPIKFSLEERREKLEQMMEYQKLLEEEVLVKDAEVEMVIERWAVKDGQKQDTEVWMVHKQLEGAVTKFVARLPLSEVLDAVDVAYEKGSKWEHQRFLFFCGVCWKKIRDRADIQKGKQPCM